MRDSLLGLATFLGFLLAILIPAMIVQDLLRMPWRQRELTRRLGRAERRLDALDGSSPILDR